MAEVDGIPVYTLGPFAKEDLTLQVCGNLITQLASLHSFSIYHGFYSLNPGYLAVFYGKMNEKKSLVSVRGNDIDRGMFQPLSHSPLLWTLHHADAISCVSRELVKKCRILSSREDIIYAPNSTDTEMFYPGPKSEELRLALGMKEGLVLGFFGELRMKKGITFILDAFRDLADSLPAVLLIAGEVRKADRVILTEFFHDHPRLKERVVMKEYTDNQEELRSLYNQVDVVLSPSLWEGMPNCILEAMACERIVLSSDAGGAKDVITHGKNGFLISVNELHRLKEAIADIAALSPEAAKKIGACGRETIASSFSPSIEKNALLDLYRHLLEGSSAPVR
jgi:glycosyltransferase involved in cell wall biosynthesis